MDWYHLEIQVVHKWYEVGWFIEFHPDVHMFVWRQRDDEVSVKWAKTDSLNKDFYTVIHSL